MCGAMLASLCFITALTLRFSRNEGPGHDSRFVLSAQSDQVDASFKTYLFFAVACVALSATVATIAVLHTLCYNRPVSCRDVFARYINTPLNQGGASANVFMRCLEGP
jgi:hypothetical protein